MLIPDSGLGIEKSRSDEPGNPVTPGPLCAYLQCAAGGTTPGWNAEGGNA